MAVELSVLPGLPAYGPRAMTFTATGLGGHAEGLVVEIRDGSADPWSGNFVRGLSKLDYIAPHPNARQALVIAGGQTYVVDSKTRQLVGLHGGAVVDVFRHPTKNAIVLNHQNLLFECLDTDGTAWKTRRISWDGFRSLLVEGTRVRGEAWRPGDTWHQFEVDLETGNVTGGSYDVPHSATAT